MRCVFTVAGALLLAACESRCQTVKSAVCAGDASVHVLYVDGSEEVEPKEALQVGCDKVVVAGNAHAVGWSVLVANCCTSYPIATSVAVLRDGRRRVIAADQTVYEWRFVQWRVVGDARRVAILSGPVHGGASLASLYDAGTGRRLATWSGGGRSPAWAVRWKRDFAAGGTAGSGRE